MQVLCISCARKFMHINQIHRRKKLPLVADDCEVLFVEMISQNLSFYILIIETTIICWIVEVMMSQKWAHRWWLYQSPFFGSSVKSQCWIVDSRDPRQNTSDVPVVTVFSAQGYMLCGKDIWKLDTELELQKEMLNAVLLVERTLRWYCG